MQPLYGLYTAYTWPIYGTSTSIIRPIYSLYMAYIRPIYMAEVKFLLNCLFLIYIELFKATGGGGGPRSKYMFFDLLCISKSRASYECFNSGSQYNYYKCVQTSNRGISKRLKKHFLRKPCMVEVPNLVFMFL